VRLPRPLHEGILLRRYRRFLADVELADGTAVTAHIADPGRLPGLAVPGARVFLSHDPAPHRRLAWTVRLILQDGRPVAVDSRNPNRLVREGLEAGRLAVGAVRRVRPEPRAGAGTRLDFLVERADGDPLWIEVKGVTWHRGGGLAAFPDAPTARGRRHLEVLTDLAARGAATLLLFVAQRGDVDRFTAAADVDPDYAAALARARAAGVQVEAWCCHVNFREIILDRTIPVV